MSKMLPYPYHHETHERWMRRCDEHDRQRKAEQADRLAGAPDSLGLTVRQAAKLKIAQAKLPQGWSYWVTNDNRQIGLRHVDGNGDGALATKRNGDPSCQVYSDGAEGAMLAIFLNRACAAVWGRQASWFGVFTTEEWRAGGKLVKTHAKAPKQPKA